MDSEQRPRAAATRKVAGPPFPSTAVYAADVPPTTSNDLREGKQVGDRVILGGGTPGVRIFECTSNAPAGSAQWVELAIAATGPPRGAAEDSDSAVAAGAAA